MLESYIAEFCKGYRLNREDVKVRNIFGRRAEILCLKCGNLILEATWEEMKWVGTEYPHKCFSLSRQQR